MSSNEEQQLRARISSLAGRINRHKQMQTSPASIPNTENSLPYSKYRGSHRANPYPTAPTGSYRGGRAAPTYRNKTLVLNGTAQPTTAASASSTSDSTVDASSENASWVSRTDRHRQLINSRVYEKDAQNRTIVVEQSQRQKRNQKDMAEKAHVARFLKKNAHYTQSDPVNPSSAAARFEISVDGIRFQVTRQGSKLVRIPGDSNIPTPRIASVGGVQFFRTKNGNLVRNGVVKAQRSVGGMRKIEVPCRTFSWTGSCPKGPRCRYRHDASKVAICRDWLLKDNCSNGEACDLSHELAEQRLPICMHFAKGKCSNETCPYVHAKHSQTDPVCRTFGFYGYCELGASCPDRHVFECPDFSNKGACKARGCKLLHRERASMMRKANSDPSTNEANQEDLSSSEDEAGASDDIDSDTVDEFIGVDEGDSLDFSAQQDFISL